MSSLFDLNGQIALVTGATGGLGQAIVHALSDHGAAVILSDTDSAVCEQRAQGLRDHGREAQGLACDLSDPLAIEQLASAALAWRGHVDILVCNAGIQGPAGSLIAVTDEAWHSVFGINLHSVQRLAAQLLPSMAQRQRGCVIVMSSISGLRGNRSIGLYALTKAALAQLARNLAIEWGPRGIRVNAISPGLIRTPLSTGLLADATFMQRRLAMTPLRRVGEPEEVAGAVVMLASRAGGFITGHNLVIDGGTLVTDGS